MNQNDKELFKFYTIIIINNKKITGHSGWEDFPHGNCSLCETIYSLLHFIGHTVGVCNILTLHLKVTESFSFVSA